MENETDVPLWTLRKDYDSMSAVLREVPDYGWEGRLLYDERFQQGHRFSERKLAEAWAQEWRDELEAKGWVPLARLES